MPDPRTIRTQHSSSIEQLEMDSSGDYDREQEPNSRQYRIPAPIIRDPCTLPQPQPIQNFSHPTKQRTWLCFCRRKGDRNRDPGIDERDYGDSKYAGTPAPAEPQTYTNYGRKWKHFPGHNRFYCGGRLMTAPNIHYCFFSFSLIVLTFGLFIAFDGPFLMDRLSILFPIISSFLFLVTIVNMLRTTCSDPGILPRASQAEVEALERSYGNTSSSTYRPPPRTKEILVNGQIVKSKYCFTCKMFRPPRASHCSICDNCVERFDHHCPFLGNCIGRRNYRSFYFFVISVSCLAVMILSGAIAHLALLSKELGNFVEALRESPTSAIVGLISFFGMWTVIGLAGFHSYLIAVEQTTNEDIKGIFGRPESKNPYTRGSVCQNCCFVLCGPSPPSLIDPRGWVTPEYLDALPKNKDYANMGPPGAGPANQNQGSNTPALPVGSFGGHECMELPKPSPQPHPTQQGPILNQNQIRFLNGPENPCSRQLLMDNAVANGPGSKSGTFPDSSSQSQSHNIDNHHERIYSPNSITSTSTADSSNRTNSNSHNIQLNVLSPSSNNIKKMAPSSSSTTSSKQQSHKSNNLKPSDKIPLDQSRTMINSPLHLDTIM